MNLPTREECYAFFEEYKVPRNILMHCETVNKVGVFLAEQLKERGVEVDVSLVDRLTLVHDLMKALVFEVKEEPEFNCFPSEEEINFWKEFSSIEENKGKHDTELTASLFEEKYPEFASMIKLSANWKILNNKKPIELQIEHYADWRVLVDKVISLQQRTDDLNIRYKDKIALDGMALWEKRVQVEKEVEKYIFEKLDFNADELKERVCEEKKIGESNE
jgi:uncharacterized protein